MHMCIYIYIYTDTCIHVDVGIDMNIYIYMYMYIYIYDVGWPVCQPASLLKCWCVQLRRARGGQTAASPSLAWRRPKARHVVPWKQSYARGQKTAGGHSPRTPRGETPQGGKQHTGKPTRQQYMYMYIYRYMYICSPPHTGPHRYSILRRKLQLKAVLEGHLSPELMTVMLYISIYRYIHMYMYVIMHRCIDIYREMSI